MLLIIKVAPLEEQKPDKNELAKFLFEQVTRNYNDTAACRDAYLADPDDTSNFTEAIDFVDGSENPELIRAIARNWNRGIENDFSDAMRTVDAHVTKNPSPNYLHYRPWLTCPRPDIYNLKKAVLALDNCFYDFAERALLVRDDNAFTTVLQPEELADIEAHPENYVSMTVHPK